MTQLTEDQRKQLAPCPFCDGTPSVIERPDNIDGTEFFYAVACYCGGYSARAHQMARRKTPEQAKADAVAAWNRRAQAEVQKPVAWDGKRWGFADQNFLQPVGDGPWVYYEHVKHLLTNPTLSLVQQWMEAMENAQRVTDKGWRLGVATVVDRAAIDTAIASMKRWIEEQSK